jgi:hypothetical protein
VLAKNSPSLTLKSMYTSIISLLQLQALPPPHLHQEKGIFPSIILAGFKLTCGNSADFRDITFDQKAFVTV